MLWKTNCRVVLCLTVFVVLNSNVVLCGKDDEDDEDPYKTTDPKKREPSPCESTIQTSSSSCYEYDQTLGCSFSYLLGLHSQG